MLRRWFTRSCEERIEGSGIKIGMVLNLNQRKPHLEATILPRWAG